MLMKNITRMFLLPLVIGFSLLGLVSLLNRDEAESTLFNNETESNQGGDPGEEPRSLDGVEFTSLGVCRRGEEFSEGNDLLSVSNVHFGSTVTTMDVGIGDFDKCFGPLTLKFKEENCTREYTLEKCIPGKVYRISIPLEGDEFCLYDAKWSTMEKSITVGKRKEFKGLIDLVGPNTLRYATLKKKKLFILDNNFCVIDTVTLHGVGTKKLNFGAEYYEEVKE